MVFALEASSNNSLAAFVIVHAEALLFIGAEEDFAWGEVGVKGEHGLSETGAVMHVVHESDRLGEGESHHESYVFTVFRFGVLEQDGIDRFLGRFVQQAECVPELPKGIPFKDKGLLPLQVFESTIELEYAKDDTFGDDINAIGGEFHVGE